MLSTSLCCAHDFLQREVCRTSSGKTRCGSPDAYGSHLLPTVRIELRLATELSRKRVEKYVPVVDWMSMNGCDLSLLKRAMEARGVPTERQHDVLSRLVSIAS